MKSYKEINDEIQAAESLKHKTLMKMQEQKAPSHVWQKTLLIATAAVLLFIIFLSCFSPCFYSFFFF